VSDQPKPVEPKDSRIEAALRDYLEQVDRGEQVDREEFLARHALIADQLRSFINAEEEVRKLAGAETPLDRTHVSTQSFAARGQETIVPQSMAKRDVESGGSELTGQFGRYQIIRALGKGAMGTVYLAEDTQIERQVALKTPHFTADPTGEQVERFFREARAAGNLRHPHICPIYDFGQIEGKHFITMAYIEGRPLSAFIQTDKPQTERQILIVIRKLALALQEAHDHGVVHRDLKPANIMVDKKGEPTIMDFGLAQQVRRNDDVRLTQTGNILGTPAFMSPEQVEGEPAKIGPPTDQYSLGVILYELLTGQLPFRGSVAAVMGQILTREPPPPSQSRSEMDQRVEAACLKMMAKNPSERFASMKALADELAAILKSPATRTISKDQPAPTLAPSPASQSSADRKKADVGASQVLKSLKQKTLTESDLASLEELARKCYSRRDFEQVIQIIERIPEERRSAGLQALLEKARGKADEIAFLICEIDEADRLNDRPTALKKAEDLLAIKPGHHRARAVQERYSGYGEGGAARIGVLDQFRRPLSDGGWIPWSALAFGLAVFGVMAGVIVIYLRGTAIVVDIQDPGVAVTVDGSDLVITGPKNEKVTVTPGDQQLTITYAGLKLLTKSFTLQKGEKRTVTVSIVNKVIVARLENAILPLTPAQEQKTSNPSASGKGPLPPLTTAHEEQTTPTLPPTFKNSLDMEFVLVPKGRSWLGGGGDKPGDKEVVIVHDFYLGKYEVTQEEWLKLTGLTPSHFSRTGAGKDMVKDIVDAELKRFPVESVSWDDAQLFLERLNRAEQETGWVYRLPTEAESEYSCRGGPLSDKLQSAYDFYFDKPTNQLLPMQANFGGDKGLKRTCKVGSYPPNRLGLYDMHGNVHEWCDDAWVPATSGRVFRGGSLRCDSAGCRAAYRFAYPPSERVNDIGLRVARVPVGKELVRISPADAVPTAPAAASKSNIAVTPTKFFQPFLIRGEWRIENDELVQPTLAAGDDFYPLLAFGEETLSNYDLTLEAKKTGGGNALGIHFQWLGPGHYREFCLVDNGRIEFPYRYNGNWGREDGNRKRFSYSSNRWYPLKFEVRGDTFRAYLDGVLQFEQTDARFARGRICLFTWDTAARFRRIKVSDPQGKVLFDGLPELPPASDNTTAKANMGNSPHVLTAGETAAKSAQKQWAERLKAPVISTDSLGIKLALIPPGEFPMGSPKSERQRRGDEQQHRVRITKPFYLGVYEITQSEFEQVMGRNPGAFSNRGGPAEVATGVDTSRYPVESVTWCDAVEFCNKLSEKEGRRPFYQIADIERYEDGGIKAAKVSIEGGSGYRLPTEAQWEYACRAGTTTPFHFGPANHGAECDCNGKGPYGTEEQGPALGRTVPVGSYRPNAFGLYDMHGNVSEWCSDAYDEAYYKHSPESDPAGPSRTPKVIRRQSKTKALPASDPAGPSGGSYRVSRGGSWLYAAGQCRSALRFWFSPESRYWDLGFRVARVPVGKELVKIPPEEKKPADVVPSPPAARPEPHVATTVSKISGRPFLVRGEWKIENDELVQPTLAKGGDFFPLLVFGEETLSNYDLTVDMKKTGGGFAMEISFHWLGPGHGRGLRFVRNEKIDYVYSYSGKFGADDRKMLKYSSNRWYTVKIEARGETFRAYVDGELQFEKTDPRFTHGRICVTTWNAAARFRRFKVSDLQGNVLFEGLPELPPASNKTTLKANTADGPRLLTVGETAAKSAQEQWAERMKKPVVSTSSLGMKLALIPPGEFAMGSPKSEKGRHGNEQQHRVRITKPFYLGVYEVTESEFEQVMGRNPSEFLNSGGNAEAATGVDTSRYPVDTVTWYDAVEFCNKLSEKEGLRPYYRLDGIDREADGWIKDAKVSITGGAGYRLPTEAQWEYACRAGTTTPFNFGTANNGAPSNCNGKAPYGTAEQGPALGSTVPVGSYRPNAFGLYDMHGNVSEWCWDVYDEEYYKHSPESNPVGPSGTSKQIRKQSKTKHSPESDPARPSGGSNRVFRGGGWPWLAVDCRAASRDRRAPKDRFDALGFRVARSSEE
jgi:formylglycine-generating enzyme required for sulfatase activity/serine/threonine protein kinase